MNAEITIGGWLREDARLTELGARVAGAMPRTAKHPWVIVRQIGGSPERTLTSKRVRIPNLQIDCYAGGDAMEEFRGQAEAWDVADAVKAALERLSSHSFEDCVITAALTDEGSRLPDPDFEPARERVILGATIFMHALQRAAS